MKMLSRVAGFVFASLGLITPALAGTIVTSSYKDKNPPPAECEPTALTLFKLNSDYVFESDLKRGDGKQDALHNEIEIDQRFPLDGFLSWPNVPCGKWYFRLGADYERFDFDTENETRLPNALQSIAGIVALEYVVENQAGILIESRPGVYFEHEIYAGSFDAPTNIAAAIPIFGGNSFYLIAGVHMSLLASPNVFPIGGILWHIDGKGGKWDLEAYPPNPRLVYNYSKSFKVWAGGQFVGGAYKTDNRDIPDHKYSGAVVTYTDYRAGAGLECSCKNLTLALSGGYSFQREFDYHRIGERFRTEGAPYVQLAVRGEFGPGR